MMPALSTGTRGSLVVDRSRFSPGVFLPIVHLVMLVPVDLVQMACRNGGLYLVMVDRKLTRESRKKG